MMHKNGIWSNLLHISHKKDSKEIYFVFPQFLYKMLRNLEVYTIFWDLFKWKQKMEKISRHHRLNWAQGLAIGAWPMTGYGKRRLGLQCGRHVLGVVTTPGVAPVGEPVAEAW
jgi:hypothetical protein